MDPAIVGLGLLIAGVALFALGAIAGTLITLIFVKL